ncbi:hypothetical protein GGR55DRAFT_537785 [Xylaria sp. FL0064]|nr:hypothetical protein GGR55DRAFT_537785 [Xylaria sp. FL0064]
MTAIRYIESMPLRRSALYQRFHNVSLQPPGRDLSRARVQGPPVRDEFCGTAAIRFPYVKAGQIDNGRLCRGCEYISQNFEPLPEHIKARAVPPGIYKSIPLRATTTRLRLRSGFIEHIKSC